MPTVSLARGDKSYDAVTAALALIRDQVTIPRGRPVLIKPNMVEPDRPLCATPVDAVRATLEFLTGLGVSRFIIAEGTALEEGETMRAFRSLAAGKRSAEVVVQEGDRCLPVVIHVDAIL
jgi:uncharacterized protein (DUF362 family)